MFRNFVLAGIVTTMCATAATDSAASTCGAPDVLQEQVFSPAKGKLAKLRLDGRGYAALKGRNYEDAEAAFRTQLENATTLSDKADASFHLALAQQMLGDARGAFDSFTSAKTLARQTGDQRLVSMSAYNLALLALSLFEPDDGEELSYTLFGREPARTAAALFSEAVQSATSQGDSALAYKSRIGRLRSLSVLGEDPQAATLLGELLQQPRSASELLLLADASKRILERNGKTTDLRKQALRLLSALGQNGAQDGPRTESLMAGARSSLFIALGNDGDALPEARRALGIAESARLEDLRFRWLANIGAIHLRAGDKEAALRALEAAQASVEKVRANLPQFDPTTGRSMFRELVGPIYTSVAGLYIDMGMLGRLGNAVTDQQGALKKARSSIEVLKQVEAEQLFQDECVAIAMGRSETLEQILTTDRATAAIYPILIPGERNDRLVLLISRQGKIIVTETSLPKGRLRQTVLQYRNALIDNAFDLDPIQTSGGQLYDWLIRPMEQHLSGIDTLVFIPDGPLRLLPWSALFDRQSKTYLVQKFAVANTIGISLTAPTPISTIKPKVFAAGLTTEVKGTGTDEGYPALVTVSKELKLIQQAYPGSVTTLPGQLTRNALAESIRKSPYTIVHLATHARFRSSLRNSYLVSADGKISLDDLSDIISPTRMSGQPIELLSLSACETATGNDKAALGLAGAALKSGARSVVASLWPITDDATPQFFDTFYGSLMNRNLSKAKAVQLAQQNLINGDVAAFTHPHYWAPYVVIGNWQ
jgi:CHAT domain-containing protein